ncbi:acyl-CoA thioesterase [Actinomadura litoris]|uniref:Acyl-CoA thioesterase n=1 Tax=Actinomadura litoris TaxID=2678616 RepID=A0A7K1L3F2_9ACTN|nr:thioesterase family protein [Actinomadura litoris]MUN38786.1 acyl-CoA thioesterase [Actinomadura litoris]
MQQTDLPEAEYRHVYEFYLRFGDIDSQGHVNNVKFLGYLEDARMEMFHGGPVRKGEQPVRGMVISRHEIDYRLPLLPTVHPVRVESWVTEARVASFKLAYEVRDDENVYAVATSTLVAFDASTNRLRRFTEEEREFIGRYLAPGA